MHLNYQIIQLHVFEVSKTFAACGERGLWSVHVKTTTFSPPKVQVTRSRSRVCGGGPMLQRNSEHEGGAISQTKQDRQPSSRRPDSGCRREMLQIIAVLSGEIHTLFPSPVVFLFLFIIIGVNALRHSHLLCSCFSLLLIRLMRIDYSCVSPFFKIF